MMTLSRNYPQVIHKLRITYVNGVNTGFFVEKFFDCDVYNHIPHIDKNAFLPYIYSGKKQKLIKCGKQNIGKSLILKSLIL